MMFDRPNSTLEELYLENYEIVPVEPLHAVKGHITNLYEEIPYHLDRKEKTLFEEAIKTSFAGKEAKRGCDYRKSLIDCTAFLRYKIDPEYHELLQQLCEIQEICYGNELQRTVASIYRFLNLTFVHAVSVHKLLGKPRSLTSRKLFGQYFHSLCIHAPELYRITSLTSINAEDEERSFTFFKGTATSSNHHPENVIRNAFIRLQVREDYLDQTTYNGNVMHKVTTSKNKNLVMGVRKDTELEYEFISNHPRLYQSHLERISDYLLLDDSWEKKQSGVVFKDVSKIYENTQKAHFRYIFI